MDIIERAARALGDSLDRRPYGGYDYGHNEVFYGPAPEAGRYVVRCEKTDKIVHQTHDQAEHDAAYERLTCAFHVRAVLVAMREPDEGMIEAGGVVLSDDDSRFMTDNARAKRNWQAMIDQALKG